MPLSEPVRNALREYRLDVGEVTPDQAIFATCRSGEGQAMHRSQAWRTIREAAEECGVDLARISTHTLRKTFVGRTYRATGNDLVATQRITGHQSPITTAKYLETDAAELDRVVLSMAC